VSVYPRRIVCLTEDTVETLYRIGAGDRVVGVSAYTMRPPEARQKPHVSAFTSARFDEIEALQPDLILCFSDLQADIAAELIRRGLTVMTFNQRSIEDILQMIRMLGALVGLADKAQHLCGNLQQGLSAIQMSAERLKKKPRVFFEEWPDPLISGIRWVEELVEIAGGVPVFPALRTAGLASQRVVTAETVIEAAPDVIVASWCGKPVRKEEIAARPGWNAIPAVRNDRVYEIKSTYILQPGPAALTEGLLQLHAICRHAVGSPLEPALAPQEPWDRGN